MPGTLISYQGITGTECAFRRSRGFASDRSYVDIPVTAFAKLEVKGPDVPNGLKDEVISPPADLDVIRKDDAPKPVALASRLRHEGELVMAEVVNGETFVVRVPGLFVERVETVAVSESQDAAVKAAGPGGVLAALSATTGPDIVRVHLVDERYFHARGVVAAWSFNRLDAKAAYVADSVRPSGAPRTLGDIVREFVAPALFRGARIAHVPDEWDTDTQPVSFEPFEGGLAALSRVIRDTGCLEPCLRLDGTLAIHRAGDRVSRVGYAGALNSEQPASGPNDKPIPDALKLYEDGRGTMSSVDLGYPDENLLVVGGKRLVTVAIDNLDPVLMIDGRPELLTDELVRKLTGTKDLAWLRSFVLRQNAYQYERGVSVEATKILRDQAYRLWRIPRATTDHAHLLPMLDRAETVDGRRAPIAVEAAFFRSRHFQFSSTKAGDEIEIALKLMGSIDARIKALLDSLNFRARALLESTSTRATNRTAGLTLNTVSYAPKHVTSAEFASAISQAVSIVDRKQVDGVLGSQYEQAHQRKLKAEDAFSGRASATLVDAAVKALEAEAKARESGKIDRSATSFVLSEALRKADSEIATAAAERKASGGAASRDAQFATAVFYENLPRAHDVGATVVSAALGVVRLSRLGGHLTKPGVPDTLEGAPFVPQPVRVIFGAVVRPARDLPGGVIQTSTGDAGATNIGNAVAATDRETFFRAAFTRTGVGKLTVADPETIPLSRTTVIRRPELVELVGLDGRSNNDGGALSNAALAVATELFRKPDSVRSETYTLARPIPVQCDGVVSSVEIRSRTVDGGPCGFETSITTGRQGQQQPIATGIARHSRRVGSDAADREGVSS